MIYFFIVFILLLCIYVYDVGNSKKYKKELYITVCVILILVSGFSYRLGVDAIRYMNTFEESPTFSSPFWLNYINDSNYGLGWNFLVITLKSIVPSFTFLKVVHAIIINGTFFYIISKWTKYCFSAVLFYFIWIYATLNFEVLREALAVSFFLLSLSFYFKKKWINYYLFILVAIMFHLSAFPFLLLPILHLFKMNKYTLLFLIVIIIVLLIFSAQIQMLFLNAIFIEEVSSKAYYYFGSEKYSVSIFSITRIINYIINILMPIYVLNVMRKKNIIPEYWPLLCCYILIYTLTLTTPVFYRFNNYFNVFFVFIFLEFIGCQYLPVSFKASTKRFLFAFGLFLFSVLKILPYSSSTGDSNIPDYARYYPYASVFTETKDSTREKLHRYFN